MLPDGRITSHFGLVAASRDRASTGVRESDSIPFPFVLYDASGAITDTIGWADRPPPRMWRPASADDPQPVFVEVGGGRRVAPSPPSVMPWWLTLPDGYIVVDAPVPQSEEGTLTITRIGLNRDTVYSRALHYRAARYGAAELDSIAARAARGEAGGMVPFGPAGGARPPVPPDVDRIANAMRSAMRFPEFKVPVVTARLGQDESIWILLREADGPTARWLIIDPTGDPRGTLELPADASVLWTRADTLWTSERDDDGVPWLVRYHIR